MKKTLKLISGLALILVVAAAIFITINWEPDRSVDELKDRWAKPPSQFIQIAGMQVHLRDEGPRNDPTPIVLLHGTGASLHTWNGWADELKKNRRVIRFDMPAFGLTGPSPDGDYTTENYVRFVVAILDKLKLDHVILGGNSLGGYVAWVTAVLYPNRIEKLILVDSSGYRFKTKSMPLAFRLANTPVLNQLMRFVLPRSIVEKSVRNVYGDPSKVTSELVDRYFDLATRTGNRQALVGRTTQRRLGSLANRVPELHLPTLILWGGLDRLIPPENGDRFHREIVGSKLVKFDNLGHVPQEEDPLKTVGPLIDFLAQSN